MGKEEGGVGYTTRNSWILLSNFSIQKLHDKLLVLYEVYISYTSELLSHY